VASLALLALLAQLVVDAGDSLEPIDTLESFEGFSVPDAGPNIEAFTPPTTGPTARLYGVARAEFAVDTSFDSPRAVALAENVLEGRLRASLGVDVKVTRAVRVVLEGRAQAKGVAQRDLDRAKGFFEPMVGEAFVDLYSPRVDFRIGQQRVVLGANLALSPADVLNPRDLRESFLSAEPDDVVLPVFALRAQGELGPLNWLVAYVPFFQPHRYFVFGQDESLLQPALGQVVDNRPVAPSIEDAIQERVLETQRPVPFAGDVALKVVSTGRFKVGGSWVWMNQKLPRVLVDPELSAVLRAQALGQPVDPATATSVANRLQAGQTLYTGSYTRAHLFSAQATTLLGPFQLDADITFSPRQTYFDIDGAPLDKTSLTWVLGLSPAEETEWVYALNYLGLAIFDMAAQEQVALIEPATARGASRTAWLHFINGLFGRSFFSGRLEVVLKAAFEPIQRSFAGSLKVTYKPVERLSVWLAGELFEGPPVSPLGYTNRNDRLMVGARVELF
jgi:hypothetical protein